MVYELIMTHRYMSRCVFSVVTRVFDPKAKWGKTARANRFRYYGGEHAFSYYGVYSHTTPTT